MTPQDPPIPSGMDPKTLRVALVAAGSIRAHWYQRGEDAVEDLLGHKPINETEIQEHAPQLWAQYVLACEKYRQLRREWFLAQLGPLKNQWLALEQTGQVLAIPVDED